MRGRNGTRTRRAIAPLGVRVALVAVAVLAVAAGALAGVNLAAVSGYDQATAGLERNLRQAARADADLDELRASQSQVDAQFDDASRAEALLLPAVRGPLETNRRISRTLTERLSDSAKDSGKKEDRQPAQAGTAGSGTGDGEQGTGLTPEQRQQVEDLLKANRQSSPSSSDGHGSGKGDDGRTSTTSKPW